MTINQSQGLLRARDLVGLADLAAPPAKRRAQPRRVPFNPSQTFGASITTHHVMPSLFMILTAFVPFSSRKTAGCLIVALDRSEPGNFAPVCLANRRPASPR